eukprot:s444_g36.t1
MAAAVPPERESWTCGRCRKINKYSANNCPKCGRYWQNVIDHNFVDPRNRSKSPRGRRPAYAQNWEYEDPPWDQQWGRPNREPRFPDQNAAPVRRNDGTEGWNDGWGRGVGQPRPKGKGKDQNQSQGKGFQTMPEQFGPQFPAIPPGTTVNASSWMPMIPQQAADAEMQAAVQEVKVAEAQTETVHLFNAVEHHGRAQQELAAAHKARGQIHSSWVAFLNASVQQWMEFAEQFTKQEQTALERITAAQEACVQACDRLNQEKSNAGVPAPAAAEALRNADQDVREISMANANKINEGMMHLHTTLKIYIVPQPHLQRRNIQQNGPDWKRPQKSKWWSQRCLRLQRRPAQCLEARPYSLLVGPNRCDYHMPCWCARSSSHYRTGASAILAPFNLP